MTPESKSARSPRELVVLLPIVFFSMAIGPCGEEPIGMDTPDAAARDAGGDPCANRCGPIQPQIACADGTANFRCVSAQDGQCGWRLFCPGPDAAPAPAPKQDAGSGGGSCEPHQCGQERPALACAGGPGTWQCNAAPTGGCLWNLVCPTPNPTPCSQAECEPAPGAPSMVCSDGSVAGPVCLRGADGRCGWKFETCPPAKTCRPCGELDEAACKLRRDCRATHSPGASPGGAAAGVFVCEAISNPAYPCGMVTPCSSHLDVATCRTDTACEWLVGGCGEPKLASTGCYSKSDVDCRSDRDCAGGRRCLGRVVNPCPRSPGAVSCEACGMTRYVCL
jgi:hypothetical protein